MAKVWRTTNRGDSWSVVGSGMIITRPGKKLASIAISPNFAVDHAVLVGTNNGVYASSNSGGTWTQVNLLSIGSSPVIRQVEFSADFATDQQIFVNVRGRGLYRVTMSARGTVTSSRASAHRCLIAMLSSPSFVCRRHLVSMRPFLEHQDATYTAQRMVARTGRWLGHREVERTMVVLLYWTEPRFV